MRSTSWQGKHYFCFYKIRICPFPHRADKGQRILLPELIKEDLYYHLIGTIVLKPNYQFSISRMQFFRVRHVVHGVVGSKFRLQQYDHSLHGKWVIPDGQHVCNLVRVGGTHILLDELKELWSCYCSLIKNGQKETVCSTIVASYVYMNPIVSFSPKTQKDKSIPKKISIQKHIVRCHVLLRIKTKDRLRNIQK